MSKKQPGELCKVQDSQEPGWVNEMPASLGFWKPWRQLRVCMACQTYRFSTFSIPYILQNSEMPHEILTNGKCVRERQKLYQVSVNSMNQIDNNVISDVLFKMYLLLPQLQKQYIVYLLWETHNNKENKRQLQYHISEKTVVGFMLFASSLLNAFFVFFRWSQTS